MSHLHRETGVRGESSHRETEVHGESSTQRDWGTW